jgi:hypothetical protein
VLSCYRTILFARHCLICGEDCHIFLFQLLLTLEIPVDGADSLLEAGIKGTPRAHYISTLAIARSWTARQYCWQNEPASWSSSTPSRPTIVRVGIRAITSARTSELGSTERTWIATLPQPEI